MEEEDEDIPLAVEIGGETRDLYSREPSDKQSQCNEAPVGVTVITGYLGSGKSTVSFQFLDSFLSLTFLG